MDEENEGWEYDGNQLRSYSAGAISARWHRLSSENIDVGNTPLSSLRSCSEYNRIVQNGIFNEEDADKPKQRRSSIWAKISRQLRWKASKSDRNRLSKCVAAKQNEIADEDEQVYQFEKMRFKESNLTFEEKNYRQHLPSQSLSAEMEGKKGKSYREIVKVIEAAIGIKSVSHAAHLPMEIELKNLREPQLLSVYHRESGDESILDSLFAASSILSLGDDYEDITTLRTITSWGNLERLTTSSSEQGGGGDSGPRELFRVPSTLSIHSNGSTAHPQHQHQQQPHTLAHGAPTSSTDPWSTLSLQSPQSWWLCVLHAHSSIVRCLRLLQPTTRSDDFFYESIRIQPFASGSYLRAMLVAGFSHTYFGFYHVVSWPHFAETAPLSSVQSILTSWLFFSSVLQLCLNIAQLPVRLQLHFQCWESSLGSEVDAAISLLRRMLLGDFWIINKSLSLLVDLIAVVNIVFSELYLWCSAASDPVRILCVSLSATNLLYLVVRIFVATIFSVSMHDPRVLREARRRGLSKWDLDVLPTFVYSCKEEVTNSDCSICLGTFGLGEMLISLPCDKKHSFHGSCIRQWLQRQNSCPLCQKMV